MGPDLSAFSWPRCGLPDRRPAGACRTAVRLGAKKVYNIYRRTKNEMPADMVEITEAEEEGVIFKNLTNPIEVVSDENGRVKEVVLQVMELGEADASGRRRPVPVEGKTEIIPWIMGMGTACTVLEPLELKKDIIKAYKDVLNNYK